MLGLLLPIQPRCFFFCHFRKGGTTAKRGGGGGDEGTGEKGGYFLLRLKRKKSGERLDLYSLPRLQRSSASEGEGRRPRKNEHSWKWKLPAPHVIQGVNNLSQLSRRAVRGKWYGPVASSSRYFSSWVAKGVRNDKVGCCVGVFIDVCFKNDVSLSRQNVEATRQKISLSPSPSAAI